MKKGGVMAIIEDDIRYLIQIAKKDLEIREKKKYLEGVPARIKAVEKEIKKLDDNLAGGRELIENMEAERRHLERELRTQNDQIEHKKAEQKQIKSNKEYQALTNEIAYLTKIVSEEEERVLTILEVGEGRKKEIQALAEKINAEKSKLLAEKTGFQEGMKANEDALLILEDEKIRILPHISENVRRVYERIQKVKGDSGVANLVGDICQGCYSRVPPQMAHEVRKNSQLIKCEVCGRILVYYSIA
jgi:uncharacterized protein